MRVALTAYDCALSHIACDQSVINVADLSNCKAYQSLTLSTLWTDFYNDCICGMVLVFTHSTNVLDLKRPTQV